MSSQVKTENYYITEKEFSLLLAGKGIVNWYGIASEEEVIFQKNGTRAEINQILAGLYRKNYVDFGENAVIILEPFCSVVAVMKKTQVCLEVKKTDSPFRIRLYYPAGEEAVVIEKSQREQGMLKVAFLPKEEILSNLREDGCFPEEELIAPKTEPIVPESEIAVIRLIDFRTGREKKKMVVGEQGVDTVISETEGENVQNRFYNKAECEEKLMRWITEPEESKEDKKYDLS